jgi:hypothetical protein
VGGVPGTPTAASDAKLGECSVEMQAIIATSLGLLVQEPIELVGVDSHRSMAMHVQGYCVLTSELQPLHVIRVGVRTGLYSHVTAYRALFLLEYSSYPYSGGHGTYTPHGVGISPLGYASGGYAHPAQCICPIPSLVPQMQRDS